GRGDRQDQDARPEHQRSGGRQAHGDRHRPVHGRGCRVRHGLGLWEAAPERQPKRGITTRRKSAMPKRGKKYRAAAALVDRTKLYEPMEALELVKKTAVANFDETIEVAYRLGVDVRHADQQIRGAVVLPGGTG